MRTDLQNIQPLAPRVYQYSLDWRFLLPIADSQKVHVVFEQNDEFSQALETLSPRCRQVIELRTVQELSYREISDSLGVPVSTLEKHLVRGKRACAEALAGWWRDGGPARPAHQRLALAA